MESEEFQPSGDHRPEISIALVSGMSRPNSYSFLTTENCMRLRIILILFLTLSFSCGDRRRRNDLALNQIFAKILKMECRGWPQSEKFFAETLLSNPYTEARQWSALAMGRMAPRQALPLLYQSLRAGDAAVRATSAFAIGQIERRACVETERGQPCISMIDAHPGDSSATAELIRLLDDPSLSVQRRAVEALGKIGCSAEAAEIARHLKPGSRPEERAYIESSLAALAKILKGDYERYFNLTNHSPFVAAAAIAWTRALEELGDLGAEQDRMPLMINFDTPEYHHPIRILSDAFCMALAASRKNSTIAIVETNRGTLEIELFREDAPLTVDNFVKLAREGVYDDKEFARATHKRFIEAAISRSQEGFTRNLYGEFNMRPFERGSVGMALAGWSSDTDRFFISLAPQPYLDGQTCFGRVVSGMQAAERISTGDRIQHISIKETISFLNYRRY
jgi:cyclophilin family peptidyl-prolyl cis-trans isomerase